MARQKIKRSIKRFEVYWVELDPTVGYEMRKTRPCVVISPDDLNAALNTVIVSPLTSTSKHYRYRVPVMLKDVHGSIALDQMRSVDKSRLKKLLGPVNHNVALQLVDILTEMFAW